MAKEQKDLEMCEEPHPCDGCKYWRGAGMLNACHFLLDNKVSRGCPPGEGCLMRVEMSEDEKRRMRSARLARYVLYSAA